MSNPATSKKKEPDSASNPPGVKSPEALGDKTKDAVSDSAAAPVNLACASTDLAKEYLDPISGPSLPDVNEAEASGHVGHTVESTRSSVKTADDTTSAEIVSVTEAVATNFHVDSDTIINLQNGEESIKYHISSCCMAAASPIWRVMLYGKEAENRPEHGEWVISLEGDPKAVDALFRIVHYDFSKVPQSPDIDELYEICILLDRYKCAHLVHPWAGRWVKKFAGFYDSPSVYADAHKVLWVSWALGDITLYTDMADSLTLSASLDLNGELVNVNGQKLKDMYLPKGLLELIASIRAKTISAMLKGIGHPIRLLSTSGKEAVNFCLVGTNVKECHAMIVGSTMTTLMGKGLFPVPDAATYTGSIHTLRSQIMSVQTVPYVGPSFKPHLSHENCSLGLHDTVRNCIKNIDIPQNNDHEQHLKNQAKITGLDTLNDANEEEGNGNKRLVFRETFKPAISGRHTEQDWSPHPRCISNPKTFMNHGKK